MTLDQKIIDYLDHVEGYRSVKEIALSVGTTEFQVGKVCQKLYWDVNNGMQRSIGAEPGHPSDMVLYATNYFVDDNPLL